MSGGGVHSVTLLSAKLIRPRDHVEVRFLLGNYHSVTTFIKMFPEMTFNIFNKKYILDLDQSEQMLEQGLESSSGVDHGERQGSGMRAPGSVGTVQEQLGY